MVKTIVVGPLETNCYVLWDESTKEAFVIDPGADVNEVKSVIESEGLKVKYIVNTHGHFDHVGGVAELKEATGAELAIHEQDAPLLSDAHDHAVIFGVKVPEQPRPEVLLEDGSTLTAGGITLEVVHTPGHTPGGVCLYHRDGGVMFTGDTIFAGSVGRTDFEGGSFEELMESIKYKILPLDDAVRLMPGHGPATTVGEEKELNPFVSDLKT